MKSIVAAVILIAFLVMSSLGLLMFFSDSREIHELVEAVHLSFGFFLTFGVLLHIILNFRSLKNHFKKALPLRRASFCLYYYYSYTWLRYF